MIQSIRKYLCAVLAVLMVFSMTTAAFAEETADLVLRGGEIQTMVSEDDVAQAVAVKDGKIVYVGDDTGVEVFIGPATRVIELEGKYVTPGFMDGHIHEPSPYLEASTKIDFYYVENDLEAYKKVVADFVAEHPDFEIYLGQKLDLNVFPDGLATNDWLDEICSDKPIALTDVSGHGRLFNSCAIAMSDVTNDTENPPKGVIYHDADGELTGYFSDCGSLVSDFLPTISYDFDAYKSAYIDFQKEANSYGVTSLNQGGGSELGWAALSSMEDEGNLNMRIYATASVGDLDVDRAAAVVEDARAKYESKFIKFGQLKYFIDGVPEGKSAYLLEPYAPTAEMDPDFRSTPACTQQEFNEMVAKANALGYQVQTHSMGDAGVQMSINAYEYSAAVNENNHFRNVVTHVTLITDEDKSRAGDLNLIFAMQPLWFYVEPFFGALEEQMFGTERFRSEYKMRDIIDEGAIVTGSNDYPVTYDFDPRHAMEAGVTQSSPYDGEQDDPSYIRNADQCVTPYEALQWYTTNGAWACFREDELGTIEVGKLADLVVLGYNLMTCDPKLISDVPVIYTISDGRIVYEG